MAYLDNVNLNPNQLLHAIGLQKYAPRNTFTDTTNPVILFGAGILIGAGLALMLTPKTGRELRNDLSRQAKQLGTAVRERMPSLPIGTRENHEVGVGAGWEDPASVS
jgi:hypothetical protein